MLHYQEWGAGDPLIALHPLALESSAFGGLAKDLAGQGLRTLAVDLPGFGRSLAPDEPLTPKVLAAPVLELARGLETPPLILGFSLGGRIALEAALEDPTAFRGIVLVAPYLPWRRRRRFLDTARAIRPEWAEYLPLERAWPLLKRVADAMEAMPALEDDWLARACVRVIYYSSCPATREAFLSASRELALDPAYGPDGLWTRLQELSLPAAFVWAGRDRLIPRDHQAGVRETLPEAHMVEIPCSGHFVNAGHHRCFERAMAGAVERVVADAANGGKSPGDRAPVLAPCRAGENDAPPSPDPEHAGAVAQEGEGAA